MTTETKPPYSINIKLRKARNSDQRDCLVWDCPQCGRETSENNIQTPHESIQSDPLCCYCRARHLPNDERNTLKLDDNGKTFRRRN